MLVSFALLNADPYQRGKYISNPALGALCYNAGRFDNWRVPAVKITKMWTEIYRWKRNKPIRNGMYTYTDAGLNVVKIETDEGITGIGLGGGMTDDGRVFQAIGDQFAPVVEGQDPLANEKIWDDLWQPKLVGRRGLTTRVISAIDNALWDVKGKAANMPVYKLLGGYSDSVPVYIAGGYYEEGKGLEDLAQEMEESVSMGAKAVKMKIGGAPINEDVERVRVVREAIGPDIDLMVDANAAYRYYEAIKIAKKMEPYDIFWFEEPVNPDDYKGHKLVSQATSIPISTGENEYTRYGFRDLIETRSVAILQPDPLIMGGITEIKKVAALGGSPRSADITAREPGYRRARGGGCVKRPDGRILPRVDRPDVRQVVHGAAAGRRRGCPSTRQAGLGHRTERRGPERTAGRLRSVTARAFRRCRRRGPFPTVRHAC